MRTAWQDALERARSHAPFLALGLDRQPELEAILTAGDGEAALEAEADGFDGVGAWQVGLVEDLDVLDIGSVGALGGDHVLHLRQLPGVGQHAGVVATGGQDDVDSFGVQLLDRGEICSADGEIAREQSAVQGDGDGADGMGRRLL